MHKIDFVGLKNISHQNVLNKHHRKANILFHIVRAISKLDCMITLQMFALFCSEILNCLMILNVFNA